MKKRNILLYLLAGVLTFVLVSCLDDNKVFDVVKVMKRESNTNEYKELQKVTKREEVVTIKDILEDIKWENGKVSMARQADYGFGFDNPEAKSVYYELWVSPQGDKVELIIDAQSKYKQLDKTTSKKLFYALTKEKLSVDKQVKDNTKVMKKNKGTLLNYDSKFKQVSIKKGSQKIDLDVAENDKLLQLQKIMQGAKKEPGIADMSEPTHYIDVTFKNNEKQYFQMWLGTMGQNSSFMSMEDTHALYVVPAEITNQLIKLIK